jgi:hypothetical protein
VIGGAKSEGDEALHTETCKNLKSLKFYLRSPICLGTDSYLHLPHRLDWDHMYRARNLFVFVTLAILVGCASPGSKYVGKWQTVVSPHSPMEIVENGKGFLIKTPASFFSPKSTIAASLTKDDTLEVSGLLGAVVVYVKSTNHLIVPGSIEYERVQ